MASFTEKRLSLHRNVEMREEENAALKSQVGELEYLANMGVASYMIAHEINNLHRMFNPNTNRNLALLNGNPSCMQHFKGITCRMAERNIDA